MINASVKSNSNTDSPSSVAVYGDTVSSSCDDATSDSSLIAVGNAEISNKCNKDEMVSLLLAAILVKTWRSIGMYRTL